MQSHDETQKPLLPEDPQRSLIVFLALGPFAVTTDFSTVGIVLPAIGAQFHLATAALAGLVAINALVYATLLLSGGRLADLVGQRRICAIGLIVFGLGTLAVMLSPTFLSLLIARAAQGAGAALLSPATFALINTVVNPGTNRRAAYRLFGSLQGLSMIAGPVLGGWLITMLGWRFAYLLELLVIGGLTASLHRVVPADPPRSGAIDFDWPGAVLFAVGLVSAVAALSGIGGIPLGAAERVAAAALGIAALSLLVPVERRSRSPLLPLPVVRNPVVLTACAGMAAAMAASTALFLLPNLIMQHVLGFSAAAAGLGMLPHALGATAAGQATGPLMARFRLSRIAALAFGALILGLLIYSFMGTPASYSRTVLLPMIVGGFGSLLSLMMMMAESSAAVGATEQGVVSALAYTSQQVGIAMGSAVLLTAASSAAGGDLITGLQRAFMLAALMGAAGLIVAVISRRWIGSHG